LATNSSCKVSISTFYRGEVLASWRIRTGKSVLTRTILGLIRKRSGLIEIFGADLDSLSAREHAAIERRIGVMFQQGALFSGLTVRQNVEMPMREHLRLSPRLSEELAMLKIELAGFDPDAASKLPVRAVGRHDQRAAFGAGSGARSRTCLSRRATSGLDPIGAAEFDELIATLQRTLGLTVFMVTHDLDSLYSICDRIAALADGKVVAAGPVRPERPAR